jgi:hypothetical protein
MSMSIKGTECEDVDWIYVYMPQDVVDCCACTYDLHKRTEILRRAGQKFTSHGGLLLWSKSSLELSVFKGFRLNGNAIMDNKFTIISEDVIVNCFRLLENN